MHGTLCSSVSYLESDKAPHTNRPLPYLPERSNIHIQYAIPTRGLGLFYKWYLEQGSCRGLGWPTRESSSLIETRLLCNRRASCSRSSKSLRHIPSGSWHTSLPCHLAAARQPAAATQHHATATAERERDDAARPQPATATKPHAATAATPPYLFCRFADVVQQNQT